MLCQIHPAGVKGRAKVPCSKSFAQRSFAAALLADSRTTITNLEPCDDTRSALATVAELGGSVELTGEESCAITGGLSPRSDTICTGESGLATRLFTPIAALCDRPITVTGTGSMVRRPIGMMIEPLRNLGVKVDCNGFLPITVCGPIKGGKTDVDGYVSSQFITGLLIALPVVEDDTVLVIDKLNSIPYIQMTIDTVQRFGVEIQHNDFHEFYIRGGQHYRAADLSIEGDWSGAAFMLAAGALAGEVTVEGLDPLSCQADAAIVRVLSDIGAEVVTTSDSITVRRRNLGAFNFDATHCPDLFPILSVVAACCEGRSEIRGVKRLIHKESNRAASIVGQFTKIGMDITIDDDLMIIEGGKIEGGTVDSCNDHRIAMAAAVAGLTSRSGVSVDNAESVTKSFPTFWDQLDQLIV